jgi:hypothetical protein
MNSYNELTVSRDPIQLIRIDFDEFSSSLEDCITDVPPTNNDEDLINQVPTYNVPREQPFTLEELSGCSLGCSIPSALRQAAQRRLAKNPELLQESIRMLATPVDPKTLDQFNEQLREHKERLVRELNAKLGFK